MAIVGSMNEKCPYFGYMCDGETGRYDENRPICYKREVKSLHPDKIVHLCAHGSAVELDTGYCTACGVLPKQNKQKALFS